MRRPTSVSPEAPLQSMLRDYWDEVADVAATIDLGSLERAAVMLLTCQARGRVVFVVGNGGSAATASHFACDLSKGTRRDGPPTFHVVSLTVNVPSDRIEVVEDAHLIVTHSLCVAVRERLASGEIPVPTTGLSVVPGRRAGR